MTGVHSTPALMELRQAIEEGFRVEEVSSSDHHVLLVLRRRRAIRTLAMTSSEALILCEKPWTKALAIPA